MSVVACEGAASLDGDGQRKWSISNGRVTVNVVSLLHITVYCLESPLPCHAIVQLSVRVLQVIHAVSLMPITRDICLTNSTYV